MKNTNQNQYNTYNKYLNQFNYLLESNVKKAMELIACFESSETSDTLKQVVLNIVLNNYPCNF